MTLESRNVEEMQSGNGRASAAAHAISVTGVGVCEVEMIGAPVPASNASPWCKTERRREETEKKAA